MRVLVGANFKRSSAAQKKTRGAGWGERVFLAVCTESTVMPAKAEFLNPDVKVGALREGRTSPTRRSPNG